MIQEVAMPKARTQKIKGTEYAYIETSIRVKGRAYPDHKRVYIGKNVDGAFVPNAKFFTLSEEQKAATGLTYTLQDTPVRPVGRPPAEVGLRKFRGLTLLLSTISSQISLQKDLTQVFGARSAMILSIAYYLVGNPDAALYRFSHWARMRFHPYDKDIPSPRSSELFASITEDEVQQFLTLQVQRSVGTSGWLAVDSSSISSYSQGLSLVTKGHNKEHDHLEQIHLLVIIDEDTNIPVFYRTMRGNINDVSTLTTTLNDLTGLGIQKTSLVLDRGYYSEENVIHLLKKRYEFTIGTKTSLSFVQDAIKEARPLMITPTRYDEHYHVFHAIQPVSFAVPVHGRGPTMMDAYLHLYCNKDTEADDVDTLMKRINILKQQLDTNTITASRTELKKYFVLTLDEHDTIIGYQEDQEKITEAVDRCGFFALLTSEKDIDAHRALSIYRKKDAVEKSFNNLKDRLSLRRTRCSKDENFRGKVFIQFIALILTSRIQHQMAEHELYKRFTFRTLIDEVDVIEYFTYRHRAGHWGEITKKQKKILGAFEVPIPGQKPSGKKTEKKKPSS